MSQRLPPELENKLVRYQNLQAQFNRIVQERAAVEAEISEINRVLQVLQEMGDLGFKTSLILSTVLPPEVIDGMVESVGADYVNLGWEHHLPRGYRDILKRIRAPVISWTENNENVFKELLDLVEVTMTDRLDLVDRYGRKRRRQI